MALLSEMADSGLWDDSISITLFVGSCAFVLQPNDNRPKISIIKIKRVTISLLLVFIVKLSYLSHRISAVNLYFFDCIACHLPIPPAC